MAVNSFREDEQMKNTQKKQIILRLFSYMNKYKLAVFGVLSLHGCDSGDKAYKSTSYRNSNR